MPLALVHPAVLGPSATKGSEVIPIGSTAPHPQNDFAIGAGASEADPAKQSLAPSRSTFPF